MKELVKIDNIKTMTSTQLAEMLGKEKSHVNRDIKKMFDDKITSSIIGSSIDSRGYVLEYHLPELESKMFVAKKDINYLEKITQFWIDQTKATFLPDFSNPADAAEAWAVQYRKTEKLVIEKQKVIVERDHAITTKSQITDKITATAMNTASQYSKRNKRLEIELDISKDYATVKRMELAYRRKIKWQPLKIAMNALNSGVKYKRRLRIKIFDANYGDVWAWHKDVWNQAFNLNIKAS